MKDGSCMCCSESPVLQKILQLSRELIEHDGYGDLKMEIRILKRGQKEVIIHCGKQYRYVVDFQQMENKRMNQTCKQSESSKGGAMTKT